MNACRIAVALIALSLGIAAVHLMLTREPRDVADRRASKQVAEARPRARAALGGSKHVGTEQALSRTAGEGGGEGRSSVVARARAGRDIHDLALQGQIERELHRAPGPEIDALIQLRHAGADHATLARAIQTDLPCDFALRVVAHRWLRAIEDPLTQSEAQQPLGSGGGPRLAELTKTRR
jgi:hypothetical protein